MSVIGQQNLSKSQNALQTSMERLSSGLATAQRNAKVRKLCLAALKKALKLRFRTLLQI